uniref:Uncharacterized protein n=1 Tax=Anguilla anguilla TaxID=7936 RepID=A0A0E9XME3_ANGAN
MYSFETTGNSSQRIHEIVLGMLNIIS